MMMTPHDRNRHEAVQTPYTRKSGFMVICSFLSLLFSLIYLINNATHKSQLSYINIVTATPSLKTYTNYDNKISALCQTDETMIKFSRTSLTLNSIAQKKSKN